MRRKTHLFQLKKGSTMLQRTFLYPIHIMKGGFTLAREKSINSLEICLVAFVIEMFHQSFRFPWKNTWVKTLSRK
jgi:hypothetical protein